MKIAIIGLPQAGQQQLFSLLTNIPLDTVQQRPLEVQQGICKVIDPRVTKLSELYAPKKTTYAFIEYLLLPDFNLAGPAKVSIFTQLKNSDEICWVTRADNAETDIRSFISELVIADMLLAEKRLENIAKEQKKKFAAEREKEKTLMEKCKAQLDAEKPVSELSFSDEDQKILRAYQFLTMKPLILVVNVPENSARETATVEKIGRIFPYPAVQLSAEIEQELNGLEEADRKELMKEMGINEPAINKMNRMAFTGLGLISFFTVGEDEVRAWPVKKGSSAPAAGSTIHSDIEKGFVRAEMFKYEELLSAGSEAKLKELGKFQLKGRDYIVEDADILSFRFNV
jgi:ribosome-binding ATPase YchF (GTP1/OBG family)